MTDRPACPVCTAEIPPDYSDRTERETYTVGETYVCTRGHALRAVLDGPMDQPESRVDFLPLAEQD